MTQDKLNKAILKIVRDCMTESEICNCEKPDNLKKLPMGRLVYDFMAEHKLRKSLKSLLQSDDEGREVYLEYHKSHEESFYHCSECKSVLISLYHRQTRTTINIDYCRNCGKKLIWPDNQESEE